MKLIKLNHQQRGFTIIELMIATSLFTLIILLVAITTIGIGRLYQKGINQTLIQDNTQTIASELTQHIQLGDNFRSTTGNPGAYCFGTTKYSYVLDKKLGIDISNPDDPESPYVLWRESIKSTDPCTPIPINELAASKSSPTRNGTELISTNSRLTSLDIPSNPVPPPFYIILSEAYGGIDLLSGKGYKTHCKGDKGQEFCGTSSLTTAITQRL
jgi:prepilin-type N-terminal cleavage/methylation domain-containing protein